MLSVDFMLQAGDAVSHKGCEIFETRKYSNQRACAKSPEDASDIRGDSRIHLRAVNSKF